MVEHRGGSGDSAEDHERVSDVDRKDGQYNGDNLKSDSQRIFEAGKKGDQQSSGNKSGKS